MKIIVLFLFLTSSICFAQSNHSFNENDWLGEWKGTLSIITPDKSTEIKMFLSISKTDSLDRYSWKTTYGEGASKMEKDYFMIAKDKERGVWLLDEDGTIFIDFFYSTNLFNSYFETQNILLSSRYELKDGKIFAEVLSSQKGKTNKSGKGKEEVISYPIYVIQKAELTRE